jgi:signal peptidase I
MPSEPPPQPSARAPQHSHGRRNLFAVATFLLVVLLFTSTFRLAVVRGDSMLPTYKDGQMVLVNKIGASSNSLKPGDVVLIDHGRDVLIKRVAYLPGDVIPPRDTWMFRRVTEFFDIQQPTPAGPPIPLLKVPPGFLVVLGDNRRVSEDSRLFGPVKANEVIGRVVNAPAKP